MQEFLRDAGHERGEDEHGEGDGEGGVGDDQPGEGVEDAEVEVHGVEAHRHDDPGDHLGDQQDEAERAAAAGRSLASE